MTKKLIALVLVIVACLSANAQLQFGTKVGLDLTNFWGKDIKYTILLNYQAGLLMEYKFNPRFGIAPEVVFAAQGGQWKGYSGNHVRHHSNYINVPVMLKYYATKGLSIDFGPQIGFNVYSKSTGENKVYDLKDWTKPVDFGIGLGATGDIDKNTFLQVRYTLGLTHVFKSDDDEYRKNSNFQLAFGVKF